MKHQMKALGCLAGLCVTALILFSAPAHATFTYTGTVTCKETGDPLEGICVFFVDERSRMAEVTTNASGEFFLQITTQGPNSPGWFLSSYAWLSTCNFDGEPLDATVCVVNAAYPVIHPAPNIPAAYSAVDPNEAVCFFWHKTLQKNIRNFHVDFQIPGCVEPPDEGEGCTYTIGWYKSHNIDAKQEHKQIPWPISEDTELCGETWLNILHTPPEGNAWYILAHQWIGATLNVANGASTTPEVDAALLEGLALLEVCSIPAEDHDAAIGISELLDDYNNGLIGPGHCDEEEEGDDDDDDDDDDLEEPVKLLKIQKKQK